MSTVEMKYLLFSLTFSLPTISNVNYNPSWNSGLSQYAVFYKAPRYRVLIPYYRQILFFFETPVQQVVPVFQQGG